MWTTNRSAERARSSLQGVVPGQSMFAQAIQKVGPEGPAGM